MESSARERKWKKGARSFFSSKASKATPDSTVASTEGSSATNETKPDSVSASTSTAKANPSSTSALSSAEQARLGSTSTSLEASSSAGKQAQNVQIKDLWDVALQTLSSREKAAIQQTPVDPKREIVDQLRDVVQQKRDECLKQRWKFHFQGREIILRDLAEKLIFGINKFKEIGDVAVNFDPVHAALPWAGVRVLLQIAVGESHLMTALLIGGEKVTQIINRCKIYELLYLRPEPFGSSTSATENLASALIALYIVVLRFLTHAKQLYDRSLVSRILADVLQPEVLRFIEECKDLEAQVDTEARNLDRIQGREADTKLMSLLEGLKNPILRVDARVGALYEGFEVDERRKILSWVSDIPYKDVHYEARKGWTNGTGNWLLNHERYIEWRASSASTILWLHGMQGAGKTKLVSTVVDQLVQILAQQPNDEALAYFYCDRNQPNRQDPALIMSSFVRQLSGVENVNAIQHPIVRKYNSEHEKDFPSKGLKIEESLDLLLQLIEIYPQTTLVVDALDESNKESRIHFMKILDTLVSGQSSNLVKIFISSRPDLDIKHRFSDGPNMEIKATDNEEDIAKFVDDKIAGKPEWYCRISPELRKLIAETLVRKSDGMFQWASLQILQLHQLQPRRRDIEERLGKLPQSLDAAYDQIYCTIKAQYGSAPDIARRAFQWIIYSAVPLSPAALVVAVCQDPNTDVVDSVDVDIDVVLSACQNLVVVDSQLDICRFSHLSVQEYLEKHLPYYDANGLIAKVCLSLLNDPVEQQRDTELQMWLDYPFEREQHTKLQDENKGINDIVRYARFHWAAHVQNHGDERIDPRLAVLLKQFLGSISESSPAYKNWHKMVDRRIRHQFHFQRSIDPSLVHRFFRELSPSSSTLLAASAFGFNKIMSNWWETGVFDVEKRNEENHSLLQIAALGGHSSLVMILLNRKANINAQGGDHGNALQAASWGGHEQVVQLLLNSGTDVNAQGGYYGSALQAASWGGHEKVIHLLLNGGADVNAQGGLFGSALQGASAEGHEKVVQLLLNSGADVNAQGGHDGNALQAASWGCHEQVVQLLLNSGADVNVQGGISASALYAASRKGHEKVVQLLLNSGADVNAQSRLFGSALQDASAQGHEKVLQLLLNSGADVNAQGGLSGSALYGASVQGHEKVIQLLLNSGADINAQGGLPGSALYAASAQGHEKVVQLLLNSGADVNAQGGPCASALYAASVQGHEKVIQLLLNSGADINAQGGLSGSALYAASAEGHEKVVQLLLNSGADVNAQGGLFGSALYAASMKGHEVVAPLLLNSGAHVNAEGGYCGSALYAASRKGHEKVVQLLLNSGADVNAKGENYGSALQAASVKGNERMVHLLLKSGADVNAQGGYYGSALQAASAEGHEKVIQLLLNSGADVNAQGGYYGSALQAASVKGKEKVVQLLLKHGADDTALLETSLERRLSEDSSLYLEEMFDSS